MNHRNPRLAVQSPDIVLESGTRPAPSAAIVTATDAVVQRVTAGKRPAHEGVTYVHYTSKAGGSMVLALAHHPLKVDLYVEGATVGGGVPAVTVNDRGLLYFEHRRVKGDGSAAQLAAAAGGAAASDPHNGGRKIVDWGEDGKPIYDDGSHGDHGSAHAHGAGDAPGQGAAGVDVVAAASADSEPGMWEETFQTHHDSKPFGPTSVGVDITFPGATHVYGIPEHASTHALRSTDGSEGGAHAHEYDQPYRLYNLDVFEYELDNPMALYGSIPFMLAHGPAGHTAGVYWNNPTETYVDVAKGVRGAVKAAGLDGELKIGVATRWVSESGVWDLSLVPGPAPKAVVAQYASLTGTQALPPLFALGYHQCRWNYKDEADVLAVDAKFEEHAFPYDVIWLDIEHTDGKRYFTWDGRLFPHPADMQDKLAARGHKMVTIIDPHIKRDGGYRVHSDAQAKGLYTRNAAGAEYDGWCWPGSSSYLDFTNPTTRDWWAEQFSLANYPGSTLSLYTW
jgi:alpha 1,3-glucosidase